MMMAMLHSAEDREVWRHRERMSKPAVQQKTTDDDDDDDDDELYRNNATLIGINYPHIVSFIIITYTVTSGTLNSTIPNHTIHHHGVAHTSKGIDVCTTLRQAEQSAARRHAVWKPKLSGLRSASTGVDDLLWKHRERTSSTVPALQQN